MGDLPGMERPGLQALPQIGDRLTFLYLEHCQINREDSAILVRDQVGTTRIPAAAITVLMLGPGTTVTYLLERMVRDIRFLLSDDGEPNDPAADVTCLWDDHQGMIPNGINYDEREAVPK